MFQMKFRVKEYRSFLFFSVKFIRMYVYDFLKVFLFFIFRGLVGFQYCVYKFKYDLMRIQVRILKVD